MHHCTCITKITFMFFGDGWWSPCPGHALLHPGLWGPARLRLAGRAGAAQHRRGGGMLDSSDFDGLTFLDFSSVD